MTGHVVDRVSVISGLAEICGVTEMRGQTFVEEKLPYSDANLHKRPLWMCEEWRGFVKLACHCLGCTCRRRYGYSTTVNHRFMTSPPRYSSPGNYSDRSLALELATEG